MKARDTDRATQVSAHRIHAFEVVLKELTHYELQHLARVLQRDSSRASRNRMELVRREIDGRRFVYLQPAFAP